jgi:cytochrome P450
VTRTLFGQTGEIDTARTGAAMQTINGYFGLPDLLLRAWPPAARRFEAAQRDLNDAVHQLIAARRQALGPDAQPSDLLSALMLTRDEEGQALTQAELRDQLLTLYVAGHETTSHALSWTFYLLSQHSEARARLDAEHARVLGGRLPTFEDLAALPYTEQVLQEALRLYPPVFAIPRRAKRDVRVGEYAVPKGSEVLLWIYYTHRDPRFYEQPERFLPERFAADVLAQRPKYAYAPFGAGQRACIGQLFALQEAQLVLATWLPRLRLEFAGRRAPGLRTGVTLAPRAGLPMRVYEAT